jgi:hypothetical protein
MKEQLEQFCLLATVCTSTHCCHHVPFGKSDNLEKMATREQSFLCSAVCKDGIRSFWLRSFM